MKIIFAGTSHGVPEKDRFCSATFLGTDGGWYIIDAGAPISPLLLRYGIAHRDVRAVFITHPHADHFEGLPEFCTQIGWFYRDAAPDIFLPNQKCADMLTRWENSLLAKEEAERLQFHVYRDGPVFRDGTLELSAVPTRHMPDAHAFRIRVEGKPLLFSGDMSPNYPEFPEIAGDAHWDLAVCECAHNTVFTDCFPTLAQVDAAHLVVNHVNPKRLGDTEARADELPFPLTVAFDGMTLTL